MGLPWGGAGHPLIPHLMGTGAMEELGGFLGLRLGGIERRHGPTAWGLLGQDRQRESHGDGQESDQRQAVLHRINCCA